MGTKTILFLVLVYHCQENIQHENMSAFKTNGSDKIMSVNRISINVQEAVSSMCCDKKYSQWFPHCYLDWHEQI